MIAGNCELLPPQVFYAGLTERCQPTINFPDGWDVWHTPNHWSNEDSMLRYFDEVIIPYVDKTRSNMPLGREQPALLICDVFAAHRTEAVREKIAENNLKLVYVPPSCTGELQPLDVSIDDPFKKLMKAEFTNWYSGMIKDGLDDGQELESVKVDLRLSIVKPIQARWLISLLSELSKNRDAINRGFEEPGIASCFLMILILHSNVSQ
jgi:hypothetical protein